MKTASSGDVDCVKILIASGADINAQNKYDWTAQMWAVKEGHVDCVKVLASPWSLSGARERINVVRSLLREKLGADKNHLHAKILLGSKELKENVILMLLGEIDRGNKKVFLDSVYSLTKGFASEFLNKQLETCNKIHSDSEVKDEIKSLCNTDDIKKMKDRVSEYEALERYKSNDNDMELDTE